jgi:hypothetical protein
VAKLPDIPYNAPVQSLGRHDVGAPGRVANANWRATQAELNLIGEVVEQTDKTVKFVAEHDEQMGELEYASHMAAVEKQHADKPHFERAWLAENYPEIADKMDPARDYYQRYEVFPEILAREGKIAEEKAAKKVRFEYARGPFTGRLRKLTDTAIAQAKSTARQEMMRDAAASEAAWIKTHIERNPDLVIAFLTADAYRGTLTDAEKGAFLHKARANQVVNRWHLAIAGQDLRAIDSALEDVKRLANQPEQNLVAPSTLHNMEKDLRAARNRVTKTTVANVVDTYVSEAYLAWSRHNMSQDDALAQLRANLANDGVTDPQIIAEAEQTFIKQTTAASTAKARAKKDHLLDLARQAHATGAKIPPGLTEAERIQVDNTVGALAAGAERVTPPELHTHFALMEANDPGKFAKLDLEPYIAQMNDGDWQRVQARQRDLIIRAKSDPSVLNKPLPEGNFGVNIFADTESRKMAYNMYAAHHEISIGEVETDKGYPAFMNRLHAAMRAKARHEKRDSFQDEEMKILITNALMDKQPTRVVKKDRAWGFDPEVTPTVEEDVVPYGPPVAIEGYFNEGDPKWLPWQMALVAINVGPGNTFETEVRRVQQSTRPGDLEAQRRIYDQLLVNGNELYRNRRKDPEAYQRALRSAKARGFPLVSEKGWLASEARYVVEEDEISAAYLGLAAALDEYDRLYARYLRGAQGAGQ